MAQFLEFEDKNMETAVKRASKELNIPKDKLKYDVISYGSTGIFGLVGIKKARIRVVLPSHKKPAKKRGGQPESAADNGTSDALKSASETRPASVPKSEQEEIADAISSLMEETFDSPVEAEPTASEPFLPEDDNTPVLESAILEETEQPALATAPLDLEAAPMVLTEDMEAALQKGLETLKRIIEFITPDVQIETIKEAERVLFDVKGGNAGILIGRRGQTLEAIQYIVEKVVNKNADNRIRIQVDIEGYLEGRQSRLEELAAKLALKAKKTGKPVALGQLNSHDRRIVHLSLRDDDAVRTQSQGDGFYRKLMIFPKKKGRKKKSV